MESRDYITGFYALNIHHPENREEPTGDWHGSIWEGIKELPCDKVTYAGINHEINTFHIWDSFGVFDDTKTFTTRNKISVSGKVYIADYFRAILDLLYESLIKYENILNLNCATYDYLDTDEQRDLIIEKINLAREYFSPVALHNLDNWIHHEINYEYSRRNAQ